MYPLMSHTAKSSTNIGGAEMLTMESRLSTMWVFVMLNMLYADIFTFITPGFLKEIMTGFAGKIQLTQEFLLAASIVTELPIAMVLLSRVLKYRANRWANIIASVVTIVYVIGGGSTTMHYIFFASMEVLCLLLILWFAWKWAKPIEFQSSGQINGGANHP